MLHCVSVWREEGNRVQPDADLCYGGRGNSSEGWREWEQNSPNWDRIAIRRVKIGAGGRGLHSHSIDFVLWVWKRRSLSLRPMNGAFLCCTLVACSDNKDGTKRLFSSSISRLLSAATSLISLDRKDYSVIMSNGHDLTLIKPCGQLSSSGASKHTLKKKKQIFAKGFELAQYVSRQRCTQGD